MKINFNASFNRSFFLWIQDSEPGQTKGKLDDVAEKYFPNDDVAGVQFILGLERFKLIRVSKNEKWIRVREKVEKYVRKHILPIPTLKAS